MDYIGNIISGFVGLVIGLWKPWIRSKLSKRILSKVDGKNLKRVIFNDNGTILEMNNNEKWRKQYEKLRKRMEETEKKGKLTDNLVVELDNLVTDLKKSADQYASLYFREHNLIAETFEVWKEKKKTLEDYYINLMKENEKISCSNCLKKCELLWESKSKELEEKIVKETTSCRRCLNTTKAQNNNSKDEERKKVKEYLQLEIAEEIFDNLCKNCSDVLFNIMLTIYNYKNAPKELGSLGQIGKWEISTEKQIIKIWEGDKIWELNLEKQNLNDILKVMNFAK